MVNIASVMTHDEALSTGLNPFVDGSFEENVDNFAVEGMLQGGGLPQNDKYGRAIISYRQFLEMRRRGMRLDNYVLRMVGPSGRGLIQATKFHKYFGEGYRPVEEVEAMRKANARQAGRAAEREANAPKPVVVVSDEDIVIYRCSDRFAECPRFFDSQRALETHWGMPQPSGHGEKKMNSKKKGERKARYAKEHGEPDDNELVVTYG